MRIHPNEKAPPEATGSAKPIRFTPGSLPDPSRAATPFSPDILAIAAIVTRARQHSPEPRPMVVFSDGHEEVL